MRVPVVPDGDGIVSVRHLFRTQDLTVRCFLPDGTEVGHLWAHPIGEEEIEVATVPGSGVAMVEVEPLVAGEGPD